MATAVFRADRVLEAAEKEIERVEKEYEDSKRALVTEYQHYKGGLFKLKELHRTYQEAHDWLMDQDLLCHGRWKLHCLKSRFDRDLDCILSLRAVARSSQNHGDGLIVLTAEDCIWLGLNCEASS